MKQIVTVICTLSKTIEDFEKKPIFPSLEKLNRIYKPDEFTFEIVKDNKRGLSEVYNSFINNDSYKNSILLLCVSCLAANGLQLELVRLKAVVYRILITKI